MPARDPHGGPVPAQAWAADAEARARGRVEVFNATRPGGLDGWTMDLAQYEAMRALVLDTVDDLEARCEIERVPGSSPQRIRRWIGPVPGSAPTDGGSA